MGLLKRNQRKTFVSRPVQNDLNAGYVRVTEKQLVETGLRGGKLWTVVILLIILWLIALATLTCNILILLFLRLNHRGMESLQFLHFDNNERLVQFIGDRNELGTVVLNSGVVKSFSDKEFRLETSKILLTNQESGRTATFTIDKDEIRVRGVDNFIIADYKNGLISFEANRPTFKLQKSIKTIAASVIKTNKVRSPIDQHLRFNVENLIFRGNEGNYFSSRNIFWRANKQIYLRTSDAGSMNFTATRGYRLSTANTMQITDSPAITANQLARRLCACMETGKLFTVPGNKRCAINPAYCY